MSTTARFIRLIAWAFMLLSADVPANPVWRDHFDGGTQLPWTSLRGDWVAADGTYAAQQPNSTPVTARSRSNSVATTCASAAAISCSPRS